MNKKGFTLIELLAVILILGVIALIAIPQVTNVINTSRRGATQSSAMGYVKAVNQKIAINQLDSDSSNDIRTGLINVADLGDVDINGTKPTEGNVVIVKGEVATAELTIDNRPVICKKDGGCTAYDRYVYFDGTKDLENLGDCTDARPTTHNAYLKIAVLGSQMAEFQTCQYFSDLGEMCVGAYEIDTARSKMIGLYGTDEPTKIYLPDETIDALGNSKNSSAVCYDVNKPSKKTFNCFVNKSGSGNYLMTVDYTDSYVTARDLVNKYSCSVYKDGSKKCSSITD